MAIPHPPLVLCFSGSDPTGGAGIQADIEAMASHGAIAVPIVTAITVQNTNTVSHFEPVSAELIIRQAKAVLADMKISLIKIGMVGSSECAIAVHEILTDFPDIEVVYDPVLFSGDNTSLADTTMVETIKSLLLPHTKILTPNIYELTQLSPGFNNIKDAARKIIDNGCKYVLVTGTHLNTEDVTHTLYNKQSEPVLYPYTRLEGDYHGSGCTLAASLAALIANKVSTEKAVKQALDYTHDTLQTGYQLGQGQKHPNRFYWLENRMNPSTKANTH